jgi:hypothetical protein
MTGFTDTIKKELATRGVKNVSRDEIEQAMLARTLLAELADQIRYNRLGDGGEGPLEIAVDD